MRGFHWLRWLGLDWSFRCFWSKERCQGQSPFVAITSGMVSTQLMLAHTRSANCHRHFHNQLATQQHHHQASKPSRPIADLCSVTTRLHHESRRASNRIVAWVFAVFASLRTMDVHLQSRSTWLFRRRNPHEEHCAFRNPEIYIPNLAALLAFAHLLLPANDIALLPASLMVLFFFGFSASVAGPSCD